MKILLVTGGTTSERAISLLSAKQVRKGLSETSHQVKLFDLKKGKVSKSLVKDFDVIFPVVHGKQGEDGSLYQTFIKLDKPYVGCKPLSSKIALDKILLNRLCDENKLPKPTWKIVKNIQDIKKFGFPSVLKASSGGSSREVVILKSEKDLNKKLVKKILSLKDRFLVEKFLPGTEITVGILFNKALPVIEIVPPKEGWFNYKNKYSGESQEIINAPSLSEETKKHAQKIALEINRKLDLFPYSRTDFIVVNNIPYVLEVNPPCGVGLTAQSLLPKAAAAAGLAFPVFLDKMVKIAYEQKLPQTR